VARSPSCVVGDERRQVISAGKYDRWQRKMSGLLIRDGVRAADHYLKSLGESEASLRHPVSSTHFSSHWPCIFPSCQFFPILIFEVELT